MTEHKHNVSDLFGTHANEVTEEGNEKPKVRHLAVYLARKLIERRLKKLGEEFHINRLEVEVTIIAGVTKVNIVDISCGMFPNNLQQTLEQLVAEVSTGLTAEGDFTGTMRIRRNYADKFVYEVVV